MHPFEPFGIGCFRVGLAGLVAVGGLFSAPSPQALCEQQQVPLAEARVVAIELGARGDRFPRPMPTFGPDSCAPFRAWANRLRVSSPLQN
jgi:hypothetical protein